MTLQVGETKTVSFEIIPHQLTVVREDGSRAIEPRQFEVFVGGGQPCAESLADGSVEKAAFAVV